MFYYIQDKPKNLYFEIIPKNASTSIIRSLNFYGARTDIPELAKNPYDQLPKKVLSLNRDRQMFLDTVYDSKNTKCFIALRDPYERAVSVFLNKVLNTNKDIRFFKKFFEIYGNDIDYLKQNPEFYFLKFLELLLSVDDPSKIDLHAESQASFFKNGPNGSEWDLVLRVESLEKDWGLLIKNFPKVPKLSRVKDNESASSSFISHLGGKGLKEVKEIYSEDYQILERAYG
jgi:hypothetical protein